MRIKEIVAEAGIAGALLKGAKALGPELEKISLPKFGASDLAKLAPAASKPIEKAVAKLVIDPSHLRGVSNQLQHIDGMGADFLRSHGRMQYDFQSVANGLKGVGQFLERVLQDNPQLQPAVVPFVQRANQLERLVMQTGHSAGDSFGMANARSAEEVNRFANELHQWIQWAASKV